MDQERFKLQSVLSTLSTHSTVCVISANDSLKCPPSPHSRCLWSSSLSMSVTPWCTVSPLSPPAASLYVGSTCQKERERTKRAWSHWNFCPFNQQVNNNNNNNNSKYISRAPNPSVSNLAEAQSAVHVPLKLNKLRIQLKSSKERKQRCQKNKQKPWMGR